MTWVLHASQSVDAESHYPTIIAVCVSLSVISVAGVLSRLHIRYSGHGLGWDDYMAGLSMVFALAYSMLCVAQTRYGLGLPLSARPQENLVLYTRVNFAGRPIYQLGVSFFKIALMVSYLRLLQGTDRKAYRVIVRMIIAFVLLAHLGCALTLIFACTPIQKSWHPHEEGTCLAPGPSFTAYAVVTIVSDIIVVSLPVPMLLRLSVDSRKKFGLIAIFALGLFTTLCSVFRYLQIHRIQDGDGNSTMLVLWGVVEFNNLVSSLPFLAPLCARKAKDYRSTKTTEYIMQRWYKKGVDGSKKGWQHVGGSKPSRRGDGPGHSSAPSQSNSILKSITYSVETESNHALPRCGILPDGQRVVQVESYV